MAVKVRFPLLASAEYSIGGRFPSALPEEKKL
jgi:hypothetical protein